MTVRWTARAEEDLLALLSSHAELAAKLQALERKYDGQFKVVFEAIHQLMGPERKEAKRIGFRKS